MTYTKEKLRQIFQQPFSNAEWQQMLQHYFKATELRAEPERRAGADDDEQCYYLGCINTSDNYLIGLFYYPIRHGNVARSRVGLRNLVKSLVHPLHGDVNAALVVFDDGRLWRLSFVCDMKGESTAPKRYTYVFGEIDNYYNTPVGRFDALQRKGISFANIMDAFSVEALSKEFFDKYREHYADIVCYITGKRYVKEKGKWVEKTMQEPCHEIFDQFAAVYKDPEKTVRDYIKKLLGRIVFLQFLQKKGWLGVPADREDWTGGDRRFLQNKFNEFEDKDNFIDGFLEPLFNDLNTKRKDDLASPAVGSGIKIPYLNGGLFQLDEEDCTDVRLPQNFLGGLLDFFEQYNFTIDENDPNDAQVGVDPEMLGRVFENLLEDNKDKGAFYTPKEIVQYMCRESLIAYLQTDLTDDAEKEAIRSFVLSHDATPLGEGTKTDIDKKLQNVKICDPAIGSGAFPMGLLRELYLCRCAVQPETANKDAAEIKRHIIQNNIYGVDIEKGAVDIARLRFWLSLIVDEQTPKHLPNLDFKIMQGNSLLEQYQGVDLSKMTEIKAEKQGGTQLTMFDDILDVYRLDLRKKLNEYYDCADHKRKEELKQEIINNVKDQLEAQGINVDFGDLDLSANDQFTLWHTWFYDVFSQGGFDIVIGNPPFGAKLTIKEKEIYRKLFPETQFKIDTYSLFVLHSLNILKDEGYGYYIIPNTLLDNYFEEDVRKKLIKNRVYEINDLSDKVFETAVVHSMIFGFAKTNKEQEYQIRVNTSSTLELANIMIPNIYFVQQPQCTYSIRTYGTNDLFSKLKENSDRLFDVLDIRQAIKSGNDKLYISEKAISDEYKPILRGKDIKKYTIIAPDLYLWYGNHLACPRSRDIFEQPKILIREAGAEITATYDDNNYYIMSSLYNAILKSDKYCLKYLLGLINSRLFQYLMYKLTFEKTKGAFTKAKIYHYYELPVKQCKKEEQYDICSIVDTILSAKRTSPFSDTSLLETKIDFLIYRLYGLTYDEILIVDPETPITREEYELNNY
ncbi:MAG: N-6 DNA methylase [Prevotella sp.]|nr:N-6 DNA methylase [Prevotella sp.]